MQIYLVSVLTLLLGVSSIHGRTYRTNDNYHAPSAPIGQDGRVVDTPEVAAARAAHLAAFSRLAAQQYPGAPTAAHAAPTYSGYSNPGFFTSAVQHGPYGYQGPPAPLASDGRVIDTMEVEKAKAAHFAAFNQAASRSYDEPPNNYADSASAEEYSGEGDEPSYQVNDDDAEGSASAEGYDGPVAPLDEDGRVVDTPEVEQLKRAHLAALQRAAASSNAPRYHKKRPRSHRGY